MALAVGCHPRIQVRISPHTEIPYIYGVMRPIVVLPEKMASEEYADDRISVFAHELSHVHYNDILWNSLFQLLQACLWFHPLAWSIRSAHANVCEHACDEYATHVLGEAGRYTSTLARLALEVFRPALLVERCADGPA